MMKSSAQFICLTVLILLCSCSGIKKAVKGTWSIDKIEYKGEDMMYDILSNMIIFESNECDLPTYKENYKIKAKQKGTWELTQEGEQYFLTIKTENEIFAGKHKVCFKKDYEKKLIKMIITSENLFVECGKWLVDFDKSNHSIDDYLCK